MVVWPLSATYYVVLALLGLHSMTQLANDAALIYMLVDVRLSVKVWICSTQICYFPAAKLLRGQNTMRRGLH